MLLHLNVNYCLVYHFKSIVDFYLPLFLKAVSLYYVLYDLLFVFTWLYLF